MAFSIRFLGGAGTVTGSKFLLEDGSTRILVDCGLFQGLKELRLRNWDPFPVDPRSIQAVVLTHAHLDHSGHLPLLYKQGFRNPVFCTPPTWDLTRIILADSAHLQEEDADLANRAGFSKHHPALPLYTREDAAAVLRLFNTVQEGDWNEILPGWRLRFQRSGHILGSAFVEIEHAGKKTVFSGDLGRQDPLILDPPRPIRDADYLIVESTYGDRLHPRTTVLEDLAQLAAETVARRGHLLIPSFAVGRTQDLLYLFSRLHEECRLPEVPIFLDSPLGINATEVFRDHPGWHKLPASRIRAMYAITTLIKSAQQSEEILRRKGSSIVIAGSGMVAGGRILSHLEHRLSDERNTVLLVGFQAAGTRGRQLQEGAHEIKLHGQYIPVRAQIRQMPGLSAHADQGEILSWLGGFEKPPLRTFIVHGEAQASDALRAKIQHQLKWDCRIAQTSGQEEL